MIANIIAIQVCKNKLVQYSILLKRKREHFKKTFEKIDFKRS